jgi:hypothetical protein
VPREGKSLCGECRSENGFENENIFFLIVSLGLYDLCRRTNGLDVVQLGEFGSRGRGVS